MGEVVQKLKQQQIKMIKEREELLKQLQSKYTSHINSLLHQKTLIATTIRTKYDAMINNITNSIYNYVNNPNYTNNNLSFLPTNNDNKLAIHSDHDAQNTIIIKNENELAIANDNYNDSAITNKCNEKETVEVESESMSESDHGNNNNKSNRITTKVKENTDIYNSNVAKHLYVSRVNLKCIDCNELFETQPAFQNHMKIKHNNLKPYECPKCDQAFKQKTHMISHIRNVHNKEKRFECNVCGKGFYLKNDWKKHCTIHIKKEKRKRQKKINTIASTINDMPQLESLEPQAKCGGLKPFKCDKCNQRFKQKSKLSIHIRSMHHGNIDYNKQEKPYRCDICKISFRRKHELIVHKRTHMYSKEKDKPYKCIVCNKQLESEHQKWEHQKKAHWGENIANMNTKQ